MRRKDHEREMTEYRLAKAADRDLKNIAEYTIMEFGVEQARNYKDSLIATFELLALHPSVGRDFSHLGKGWRRHPHRDHCIYYKEAASGTLVPRLIHSRQDPARSL